MEFDFFMGIDVSKNNLDFALMQGNKLLFHRQIANTPPTIRAFLKELNSLAGFDLSKSLFCMEHTGVYCNYLLGCLHRSKAHIVLEAATQIRSSLGTIRGKNDKIDAIRIADYAYKHRETLRLWVPKRLVIQQLSHFLVTRARLIKAKNMLKISLKETEPFVSEKLMKQDRALSSRTLQSIEADLKKTEKCMEELIASDGELKRLFSLVTSVSGVGKITAAQMIITTNEFKQITDPKKYACYSGVAPFTKESGLFRGKARVSHMANKKVKTLLHMAALVAIRYNQDLKDFYLRKTEQEKKNKMSTLNAVRNKLILRIFACVNRNKPYEKKYQRLVA